jgi:hypothetical protein
MANIADTLLELLSVPLTDPRWINIFHEQEKNGAAPRTEKSSGKAVFFFFPKLGVQLNTDGFRVVVIDFFVGPQYTGDLPFGLKPSFKIADVHKILGPPTSSDPQNSDGFSSERYLISHYSVFVSYPKDETLHLISIFRTSET